MQYVGKVTEERRQSVIDECTNIRERFGFNNQVLNKIAKFYLTNIQVEMGSVEKTISYIVDLLVAHGLDEEGIKLYFRRHKNIYLTDYYDFRKKLSILNHCGLLEEGLNHDTLLSYEYTRNGLSANLLFAMCVSKKFNITLEEISNYSELTISKVKDLLNKYKAEIDAKIGVEGYHNNTAYHIQTDAVEHTQWAVADFPCSCSMSPITEPEGWEFEIPEGSREFAMKIVYGQILRYALILKNAEGKYDRVAIYKDKATAEPLAILEDDVFYSDMRDTVVNQTGEHPASRNLRMLKIAEDGSYVRIWASRGMSCEDDSVWTPRSLFKEITDKFGQVVPTSQMTGNDPEMILKCNHEQWKKSAEWQSKCMHYMIQEHGVEVIFSHYHGPDLEGHNYMKYLKERPTSKISEDQALEYAAATYSLTDDYIGSFMHLIDEGWTIMVFSDHAQVCPEAEAHVIGESCGICVDPLRSMGYTVMKKDENGKDMPEVDWSKTRAVQTRSNSIYINLKGREPHGIVDPADKYELEEQIITDLYNYKDATTGHRIVSMALHNKDAVLLGLGGPMGSDIVFFVHDDYCYDHGNGLSTACGHNNTTLSPIFLAAGPGIKANYRTTRYIREVDVAPTAAVLLGVDVPAECEGAPAYQILSEKL